MNESVYIRPLEISDAMISYHWRNNPRIWRFTGARPDQYITPEMETAWISEVITRKDEMRFAICLVNDNRYIGNVFFTDISEKEAQLHIFIGEMEFWGKQRAYEAICLLFDYGFNTLKLDSIYNQINSKNAASLHLSRCVGFKKTTEYYDVAKEMMLEKMVFTREMYEQKEHRKHPAFKTDTSQ